MSGHVLDRALDEVARPLRGLSGLARLTCGVAAATFLLALAAWLARGGVLAPALVLGTWVLVGTALVAGVVLARRAIRGLGPWHVGEILERGGAWRKGSLTTVLDPAAPDTSAELHAAAAARCAAEVRGRAPAALSADVTKQLRVTRRAAVLALFGIAALAAARPLTGASAGLWDVAGAWQAMTAPVALEAREGTVAAGQPAVLVIRAAGRRRATLFTRAPGEQWRATEVVLDGQGRASFTTAPLSAELVARAEAGGHRSGEVRVGVRLGAFLGMFTVTARYPGYLGLDDEVLSVGGDTLPLPEGTRLAIAGQATATLTKVELDGAPGHQVLAVDGGRFGGEVTPQLSGAWRLHVSPAAGVTLSGEMPVLLLRIVPDSAPVVEVLMPGADTVASPAMRLPLVVSLRDDHGLRSAAIERWIGAKGVVIQQSLGLLPTQGDRALVTVTLDFTALGLKPGDTLHYVATGTDNAPVHHQGRSREFMIRIPNADEQRVAQQQATAKTGTALDSLAAAAKGLQRTTEELSQELPHPDIRTMGDLPRDPLARDAARKGEAVVQAQEKLLQDAERLAQSIEELRRAAERQGLVDSSLAARLEEVRRLLDKAMSPELREKLAALQQSLKALDADRTQGALRDLAKAQAQLKEALEQTRELFKRAALESDLGSMAKEARALAGEQRELTPTLTAADSGRSVRQEQQLAKRTDSLAAGLSRATERVPAENTKQGLQQAAEQARDAAAKMRDAAQSAKDGDRQKAQQAGEAAEMALAPLEEKIRQQREQMQAQMRKDVSQGLERALQETSRLAQRQMAVAQALDRGAIGSQARTEEGLLEEGTGKVLRQVLSLGGKNALVSPHAATALAAARELMRGTVDAVAAVNSNRRVAAEQSNDAVDALAVAAFQLLAAKEKVDGSQSASGMQEAMEQMQKMAGQQGQLARQGEGMMQQGQSGLEQLMQMAMQQHALAQQLDRLRARGMLPSAGEMAREAKDLARTLEAGRLTRETVNRQQRLFKKMLDAGRTLQGEEDDQNKERQSTTAKDDNVRIPALLDPRLRSGQGDIRLPSWEMLQRLSPEDRRRVIDYFRRLTDVGGHP